MRVYALGRSSQMNFPSAIWRIERPGPPSYLYVDSETGRIIPTVYNGGSRYLGFGLWFHDYDDYEIVTTHIKRSEINLWLHEYFRIDGDLMQWSNYCADILHYRVTEDEVPIECRNEFHRILSLSESQERPAYDPSCIRPQSK